MSDVPESHTFHFVSLEGLRTEIVVTREAIEDDIGGAPLTFERFAEWVEINASRALRAGKRKAGGQRPVRITLRSGDLAG